MGRQVGRLGLVRLGHVGQVKVSCKKIVYVGSYYQLYDFVVTFFFIVLFLLYSSVFSNYFIA